jgi:hypothetical protein
MYCRLIAVASRDRYPQRFPAVIRAVRETFAVPKKLPGSAQAPSFLEKTKIFCKKCWRALLTACGTFGYYAPLPRSLPTHNSNSSSLPPRCLWRKQTLSSGLRLQVGAASWRIPAVISEIETRKQNVSVH